MRVTPSKRKIVILGKVADSDEVSSNLKTIAFILAFKDKPWAPLVALSKQTLKPEKVVIVSAYPSACVEKFPNIKDLECLVVPPNLKLSVGERVGIALTVAFNKYNIALYDYVIRLDEDFYFDERFLEDNIRTGYDLIGCHGAMLVKSSKISEVLGGRWAISPMDDAVVIDLFRANGCSVLAWSWIHPPIYLRKPRDTYSRGIMFGRELYRMGYPFINLMLDLLIKITIARVIPSLKYRRMKISAIAGMFVGYTAASLRREKHYPFAATMEKFYKKQSLVQSSRLVLKEIRSVFHPHLINNRQKTQRLHTLYD